MKIDFKIPSNVNRNTTLANDDFSLTAAWAESISTLGLQGIIFHNNFSEATCKLYQSEHIHFIKVDYNPQYNPNVFRYFVYSEFLKLHSPFIKNIFFTDVSDVTVLKNPFLEELYLNNPTTIFCGDEPEVLENEWMQKHSEHLRKKIPDYATYENDFKKATLLNCGIIGGNFSIIYPFIEELWGIHLQYNATNNTPYTGDMGAFNYLLRTRYHNKMIHGSPVNTEFKSYKTDNLCWFKHK
ncbi:hypothetical protein ABIB40_003780 [Pedobacter sp. UYP30]|uniref:hypothetical protein n=1 Tax=Pedobacter sp. UYP30 TaxID=1756400 RepID=UPI003391254C